MKIQTIILLLFSIFATVIEASTVHEYEQSSSSVSIEASVSNFQLSATESVPSGHCHARVHCCQLQLTSPLDYSNLFHVPMYNTNADNFSSSKLKLNSFIFSLDRPPTFS